MSVSSLHNLKRPVVNAPGITMIELAAGCILSFPIAGIAERISRSFPRQALSTGFPGRKQAVNIDYAKGDDHAYVRKVTILQE